MQRSPAINQHNVAGDQINRLFLIVMTRGSLDESLIAFLAKDGDCFSGQCVKLLDATLVASVPPLEHSSSGFCCLLLGGHTMARQQKNTPPAILISQWSNSLPGSHFLHMLLWRGQSIRPIFNFRISPNNARLQRCSVFSPWGHCCHG